MCWGPIKWRYHPNSTTKPWWYIIPNCPDPHLGRNSPWRVGASWIHIITTWLMIFEEKKVFFLHNGSFKMILHTEKALKSFQGEWLRWATYSAMLIYVYIFKIAVSCCNFTTILQQIAANHQNFGKSGKKFLEVDDQYIVIFSFEICIAATCIFISFLTSKINTLAFLAAACSKSYFMQLRN